MTDWHWKDLITAVTLGFAVISFVVYLIDAYRLSQVNKNPVVTAASSAQSLTDTSVKDISDLTGNLAKLVEALSKAGPALTALIASILFLMIAVTLNAIPTATDQRFKPDTPATSANPSK